MERYSYFAHVPLRRAQGLTTLPSQILNSRLQPEVALTVTSNGGSETATGKPSNVGIKRGAMRNRRHES